MYHLCFYLFFLSRIYDLQEQGYSYNDVESLLRAAADEEFLNATKVISFSKIWLAWTSLAKESLVSVE